MDLLGKPFEKDARGPAAYDCVGLLLEIERRLGRTLPEYDSREGVLILALVDWEPVSECLPGSPQTGPCLRGGPLPGDAILFRSCDPSWHVGVVTGDGWMIHAHPDCGVVRERYNALPWHNRIEGFYRWKQV